MKRSTIAAALLLVFAASFVGAAAEETPRKPYGDHDGNVSYVDWTEDREEVTVENVTHYVSRVGAFVIGDDPEDPTTGAIFTGLLVTFFSLGVVGTSRAGLTASCTMGIAVAALLSDGIGLFPRWVYGVLVMLLGLIVAVVALRLKQ